MPTKTACDIIRQASEMGVQRISITGGEPFLKEDLEMIIKEIYDNGIHLYPVFTNGSLIKDNLQLVRTILSKYSTAFYISLHGLRASHEFFSEAPTSYSKVIEAIKILQDMGAMW